MSLSILNNIAALYAQNNLNSTQSMLQTTLQQLSSGSRINSGADDPSGLAVSNGMAANVAALTQSATNATSGIGLLQTADGALSQVTSLLDQATTLATEASGGTLTSAQLNTANQEYQNILTQIANIGAHTNFNSNQVLTNSAVNMAVGDGTTTGTSIYSNIVGVLTKSSVGTTGATPIASVVSTPPIAAVPNSPGQYTLTAGAGTDTLAGTISFNFGGVSQQNINVVAGSSLSTVSGQLADAGLSNAVSNNVIDITGPTAGADAAANTVNFSGTSLSFTPAATNVTGSAVGVTDNYGSRATANLALIDFTSGDHFGGTFTLSQGSDNASITIAPGSTVSSILTQIQDQTESTNFSLCNWESDSTNIIFEFQGDANTSPFNINVGTLTDTSNPDVSITGVTETAGSDPTQGTFVLGALNSSSDTFGSGGVNANTLDINGTNISIAEMTATEAMDAINNNTTMQGEDISATVNGAGTQLTILGDTWGGTFTVQGYGGGALALTDQAAPTAIIAQITAPTTGNPDEGGTAVITMSSSTDTLSGPLKVVVNGNTASLTVAANTTGLELQNQINLDGSFQTASLTAVYNSGNATITITGPTGAGNSLDTTGTSLTDTTASGNLAGAGANFTTAGVSVLNASTAAAVLTTITAAVADVAYQRGSLGADINELSSASSVASAESINLASAQNSITATNYGQAASNLSKYQILSQTGISALAQANTVQQEVLKLLQ